MEIVAIAVNRGDGQFDARSLFREAESSKGRPVNPVAGRLQTLATLALARENDSGRVFRGGERQETIELP